MRCEILFPLTTSEKVNVASVCRVKTLNHSVTTNLLFYPLICSDENEENQNGMVNSCVP